MTFLPPAAAITYQRKLLVSAMTIYLSSTRARCSGFFWQSAFSPHSCLKSMFGKAPTISSTSDRYKPRQRRILHSFTLNCRTSNFSGSMPGWLCDQTTIKASCGTYPPSPHALPAHSAAIHDTLDGARILYTQLPYLVIDLGKPGLFFKINQSFYPYWLSYADPRIKHAK